MANNLPEVDVVVVGLGAAGGVADKTASSASIRPPSVGAPSAVQAVF